MISIALECKPDETFIRALGFSRRMIVHQPNKGEVINYLRKNPEAIGIVDEDPGSANPSHFNRFLKRKTDQFDIQSMHIPNTNSRLLVVKPRLEEWIIKYAIQSNIDLSKYSLPNNGKALHKVINTRLPRFKNMIEEMLEVNSEALIYLKSEIE